MLLGREIDRARVELGLEEIVIHLIDQELTVSISARVRTPRNDVVGELLCDLLGPSFSLLP